MDLHELSAPLRSFVARRVPGDEVDDVVQDVLLRIQQGVAGLRDAERIDAWIFQIARNVITDGYRRRGRHQAFAAQAGAEPLATADDGAAVAELTSCLPPMIARLPEPYRTAIEWTELQGLTQTEAASRAALSISGMKSRVQRGREQLKQIILASCRIGLDVRGGVIECDPLRPSACSPDSMGMTNMNQTKDTELSTTTKAEDAAAGCCGGPARDDASACCALDAEVKSTGGAGCGCGTRTATTTRKGCC
jgi:RNA polymerase sigma-70 factor, ECF subfamily